jgi:hypothetical protein
MLYSVPSVSVASLSVDDLSVNGSGAAWCASGLGVKRTRRNCAW